MSIEFLVTSLIVVAIPGTGVTLPFVSYGGSSLLSLMMGMGVLLSISREYNRLQSRSS